MADPYVYTPQAQSPDEIRDAAVSRLQSLWPQWEPSEGNLDWQIIVAFSERAAIIQESVTDVLRAIFRYFGSQLANVPVIEARAATGTVQVTTTDGAGYTVAAGETFGFTAADGTLQGFQLVDDLVIPANFTTGTASVVALETGAQGSGLTGNGQHDLSFVSAVTLTEPTKDGQDAESDDDYLDRLRDELRLSSPRPILADDYAVLARRFPEVEAAVAIDNYNGTTYDVDGVIAIVAKNAAGEPVSSGTKAALDAMYVAERLPGLLTYVLDPTYTQVDVAARITAWADFDVAAVKANVDAAIRAFLSPATWGQPDYGETRRWVLESKVRYLEVAQIIQSVEGVRYLETLTLSSPTVAADAKGDLTLAGAAPLPRPRTIEVTS